MNTIHKTIDIPQSRLLNLEVQLPENLPVGKAEIMLMISPVHELSQNLIATPAKELPPGRHRFQGLAGSLSQSKVFEGDPVEVVRAMRDEW